MEAHAIGEGRHTRGASLAVKLAAVIAGMVLVFMLGFALFLRAFVHDTMREQVVRAAKEAARAASQAELPAWEQYYSTPYQGMTKEQIQAIVDQWTPEQFENRFLTPEQRSQREWNRGRLQRFRGPDSLIVEVDIVSPDRGTILATSFQEGTAYRPTRASIEDADQASEMGYLGTRDGASRFVVRGQHPILDRAGAVQAFLGVYIDARNIELATRDFMLTVSAAAAVLLLLAAGLSFAMGRAITRPLKRLQEDIRIVAGGDLDHHTVPRSSDEVGQLARTFDHMTKSLREAREAERATARAQHQMAMAGEVTDRLFPDELPALPGWDMAGHHEVAGPVGGEYYDVLPMGGGRHGFLIASASGTGVPAAMVMAMARSFLEVVARDAREPDAVLRRVNELLAGDLREGMYVSMLLAALDPESGTLDIANAGHAPLLLRRADGSEALVHSEGIALGFDEGPVFDRTLKARRIELHPGDRVVFSCAPVAELRGADGEPLGAKRFAALVAHEGGHPSGTFMRRLAAILAKFRGKQPLSVDVTLLTLRRQP